MKPHATGCEKAIYWGATDLRKMRLRSPANALPKNERANFIATDGIIYSEINSSYPQQLGLQTDLSKLYPEQKLVLVGPSWKNWGWAKSCWITWIFDCLSMLPIKAGLYLVI